jgi:hypothetical protein
MAAPGITITSPENGKTYTKDQAVTASFACSDAPVECSATLDGATALANGAALNTSTPGMHYITVTAKDASTTVQQQAIYYVSDGTTDPGGSIPPTLAITLGQPGTMAPFVPGIAADYTTTVTAQILSTAGDAVLSVADGSATHTGHLVNGAFALASPLQIAGARPPQTDAQGNPIPQPALTFAPIGGNANPTTLITYNGPINETDTLSLKQPITATEALRTGAYSKTFTFTLSTTQP